MKRLDTRTGPEPIHQTFTHRPDQREVDITYTDINAESGKTYYYYVRVEQQGGQRAWASPMWVTCVAIRTAACLSSTSNL